MKRALHWVLVLTVGASFILIDGLGHSRVEADENYERPNRMLADIDASGFISIDCGSGNDYMDKETGIWFQTDKNFVETGKSYTVPGSAELNYRYFAKRLNTLRCFPEGERNCYTLRPEEQDKNNSRYLIRALFSYGNCDGKNQSQSFDLYLGVNRWDTISLEYDDGFMFSEAIHTASSDSIQVCLVKTGPTIPCISSLELRPLSLHLSCYVQHYSTTTFDLLVTD